MAQSEEERDAIDEAASDSQRFKHLPERVKLEDTVESHDTRAC
jgi:hypothetical protein